MFKYITCYKGTILYVIKFYVENINNTLRLIYEIYELRNKDLNKKTEESFKVNPESDVVFNSIPLEKKFIQQLSQLEVGEQLGKFTIDRDNLNNIGELRLPKLTIRVENYKIIIVYNFLKSFFENYENIKITNIQNEEQEKPATPKIQNIIPISITDILKLVDKNNNLLLYYLHRYMDKFHFNLESNKFELTNKTLKLYINNFIYDRDSVDSKNLYLLITNINNTEDEVKNTLNILFKYLIKIINTEVLISETKSISEEQLIKINILNVLILIYGVKSLFESKITHEKLRYLLVLNHVHLNLMKSVKNLEYDRIEVYEALEYSGGEVSQTIDLKTISKKYNYLISISKEEFIKSVLHDVRVESKIQNFSKPMTLTLNNPKILNVDYLLTLNSDCDSLINYKLQKTQDFITSKNIISIEYLQLLYIIGSSGFINKSSLNLNVTKFADLIINEILPALDKKYEMFISTLIIMNDLIDPIIKSKTSFDISSKFFLIYRIVIPHLYSKYNMNKFIDYFF